MIVEKVLDRYVYFGIAQVIAIILKLVGVISFSWWLVWSPAIILATAFVVSMIITSDDHEGDGGE